MTDFETNTQADSDDAITRLESLAILMANGREYDAEFVEACVLAADMSMPEFAHQVELEIRERVRGQFAAMGYAIDFDNEIAAADPDEFDDDPQPYDLHGNVPHGATAVVYHDGRKLGEIKATSGRFELQAAMPRGMQTVKVLAVAEDGRSLGSDEYTFTVR